MASIRKAKKLGLYKKPKISPEKVEMYEQTRAIAERVNRRLKTLKQSKMGGTWSSKKLANRLNSKTIKAFKKGKVVVDKDLTTTQMIAIQKASSQFLVSETSTLAGIERVKRETIKSLKATLATDKRFDNLDAETAYSMLSDDDFNYFNNEEKVGASTLWALLEDSIEYIEGKGESAIARDKNSFINKIMNMYDSSNDVQARERLMRLYNNYVL